MLINLDILFIDQKVYNIKEEAHNNNMNRYNLNNKIKNKQLQSHIFLLIIVILIKVLNNKNLRFKI